MSNGIYSLFLFLFGCVAFATATLAQDGTAKNSTRATHAVNLTYEESEDAYKSVFVDGAEWWTPMNLKAENSELAVENEETHKQFASQLEAMRSSGVDLLVMRKTAIEWDIVEGAKILSSAFFNPTEFSRTRIVKAYRPDSVRAALDKNNLSLLSSADSQTTFSLINGNALREFVNSEGLAAPIKVFQLVETDAANTVSGSVVKIADDDFHDLIETYISYAEDNDYYLLSSSSEIPKNEAITTLVVK